MNGGGLELLQMVLESNIERCVNEDASLQVGELRDLISIRDENEIFFVRVFNKRVLKL